MLKYILIPCPFCGKTHSLSIRVNETLIESLGYKAYVNCDECDITIWGKHYHDTIEEAKADAIRQWNTRADDNSTALFVSLNNECQLEDLTKLCKVDGIKYVHVCGNDLNNNTIVEIRVDKDRVTTDMLKEIIH